MIYAFIHDVALLISLIIAVVLCLILWRIHVKQLPTWAKTKDGKGVIKGVVLAPLAIMVYERFKIANYLTYSDERTQQGLALLEAKGLVTPERHQEIIAVMTAEREV